MKHGGGGFVAGLAFHRIRNYFLIRILALANLLPLLRLCFKQWKRLSSDGGFL